MTSRPRPAHVSGSDLLPTAAAVRAAKDAALAGIVAELANLAWPPGPEAHQLLDWAPLLALDALHEACPGVKLERLARCLGLDPLDGPDALERLRITDAWPRLVFNAAVAVLLLGDWT